MRPVSQGMISYRQAHVRIQKDRGRAAEHLCSCGVQAKYWAYQHSDPDALRDDKARPYSLDPGHYAPMCARCHRQYDIDNDPRVGQAARVVGAWRGGQNRDRLQSDPEYAARMKAQSQTAVKKVQRQRRKCAECDLISTPFGIGSHQRRGHRGYIEVGEAA